MTSLERFNGAVPIDPNGEIKWDADTYRLHNIDGTLLVSPDFSGDPFVALQSFNPERSTLLSYGRTAHGSVYKTSSDYAIKVFDREEHIWKYEGRLDFLRPNVALAEGIKRVEQDDSQPFAIRGLEIHAAFLPFDEIRTKKNMGNYCMWLMEYVDEPVFFMGHMPSHDAQRSLYDKALEALEVPPNKVNYDLGSINHPLNLLIEKGPRPHDQKSRFVKIDVAPIRDKHGVSFFDSY